MWMYCYLTVYFVNFINNQELHSTDDLKIVLNEIFESVKLEESNCFSRNRYNEYYAISVKKDGNKLLKFYNEIFTYLFEMYIPKHEAPFYYFGYRDKNLNLDLTRPSALFRIIQILGDMCTNVVQHYQSCCDSVHPERFEYEKVVTKTFNTFFKDKRTRELNFMIIDNCSQKDEDFALLYKITEALICNYNFKNNVMYYLFALRFDNIDESNIWNETLKNYKSIQSKYEKCKDHFLLKNFSLNKFYTNNTKEYYLHPCFAPSESQKKELLTAPNNAIDLFYSGSYEYEDTFYLKSRVNICIEEIKLNYEKYEANVFGSNHMMSIKIKLHNCILNFRVITFTDRKPLDVESNLNFKFCNSMYILKDKHYVLHGRYCYHVKLHPTNHKMLNNKQSDCSFVKFVDGREVFKSFLNGLSFLLKIRFDQLSHFLPAKANSLYFVNYTYWHNTRDLKPFELFVQKHQLHVFLQGLSGIIKKNDINFTVNFFKSKLMFHNKKINVIDPNNLMKSIQIIKSINILCYDNFTLANLTSVIVSIRHTIDESIQDYYMIVPIQEKKFIHVMCNLHNHYNNIIKTVDSRFKNVHAPSFKKYIKEVIYYMLFFRAYQTYDISADEFNIRYILSKKYIELYMIIIGTKYNIYQIDKSTDRQKIDWILKYIFESQIFYFRNYIEILEIFRANELFFLHRKIFITFAHVFILKYKSHKFENFAKDLFECYLYSANHYLGINKYIFIHETITNFNKSLNRGGSEIKSSKTCTCAPGIYVIEIFFSGRLNIL